MRVNVVSKLRLILIGLILMVATPLVWAADCTAVFPSATNPSSSDALIPLVSDGNLSDESESNDVTISLAAGQNHDYDGIKLGNNSTLSVSGTGTARLHLTGTLELANGASINEFGNPEDLVIYTNGNVIIGNNAVINALIYANGNVTIGGGTTTVVGAVSANGSISVGGSGVTYDASAVSNADFAGMCTGGAAAGSLVVDFRFDESAFSGTANDVIDSSANAYHADSQGGINTTNDAHLCRAAAFDGVDDYIESSDIYSTLSNTASMSFWIKTTQTGNNTVWQAPGVAGIEQSGGVDDMFWGWLDASGRIGMSVGDSNNSKSTTAVNDDQFHHVVLTRDATTGAYQIFVDGVREQTGTMASGVIGSAFSSIGRIEHSSGNNQAIYLQATLDELKIYDYVLSDGEVSGLFGETRVCLTSNLVAEYRFEETTWNGTTGEVADTTSNALDGTAVNGPTTANTTPDPAINTDPGTCRYGEFGGADQYVAVPDNDLLDLSDSLTITAWIYTTSTAQQTIVSKYSAFNFDYNYQLQLGAGGTLLFRYYSGGSDNFVQTNLPSVVSANTWTHVAVTYEDGAQRFYINGTEATGGGSNTGTLDTNDGALTIGTDVFFSFIPLFDFQGAIDEVRLYDGALNQSDIQAIYNDTHACGSFVVNPEEFVLTTRRDSSLSGLSFRDRDLIRYNPSDDSATLSDTPEASGGKTDANAIHYLDSGNIVYSFNGANQTDNSSGSNVTVTKADLLEYNPVTDEISFYLMGEYFDNDRNVASNIMRDIDALYIVDDDTVIISTQSTASIENSSGSTLITVGAGDLVELTVDRNTHTVSAATMFFEEGVDYTYSGSGSADITGFHIKDDGHYLINFGTSDFNAGDYSIGGYSVDNWNDVVEYDPSSGQAGLYFDGTKITPDSDSDIDGLGEYEAPVIPPSSELLVLATQDSETLGGLSFDDEDAVLYDPSDNTATLHFDGGNFSNNEALDAFSMLDSGNYIISTEGNATLGGLSFDDDDLVEYNPNTNTATLYVNMRTIAGTNIDVDAAHALDNGDVIFSTTGNFGAYEDEDLILYDASSGSLSSYLDTSSIGSSDDIKGVYVRDNGNILMSFSGNTTVQGVSVLDGDVVEYNPSDGTASIYFSESEFSGGADVRAVHLIEVDSGPTVDRYQISHTGTAVTCEPATVTITALDSSGAAVNVSGNTTLTVTTDPTGPTLSTSSPVILDGTSSITIEVTQASPLADIDFDVSDGTASENDGDVSEDPNLTFVESILRFYDGSTADIISTQEAATSSSNITLRAIRTDNDTGACVAGLQGTTDVEFAYECNSPATCSGMTNPMTILGNTSVSFSGDDNGSGPSYTTVELTFDNAGIASSNFNFQDAGQLTLSANIPDANISLSGSSQPFWVRPDKLVMTAQNGGGTNLNATSSADGTQTHPAGAAFNLSISALNASGTVTENYQPGNIRMSLDRTGPTGTGVEGSLQVSSGQSITSSETPSFANVSVSSFVNGVSTYSSASYSEVGLIQLDIEDSNYGNSSIQVDGDALNIGRFIPGSFSVAISNNGSLEAFCNGFSYLGQNINYDSADIPQITVTALNAAASPQVTRNYTGSFIKLTGSEIDRSFPSQNYTVPQHNLATSNLGSLSLASESNGVLTFDFAGTDTYTYSKTVVGEVIPFDSDVQVGITRVNDGEVATNISGINVTPTAVEVRYGRWNMENTFGSELSDLTMLAQVEYLDASSNYVVNTDDACTDISESGVGDIRLDITEGGTHSAGQVSDIPVDASDTDMTYNSTLLVGSGDFEFSAPGFDQTGAIEVVIDLSEVPWLRHDWDGNGTLEDHPNTTATFGRYRGNDRIIYWREVTP